MKVTFGVPKGSILGPTLFTIYINDLVEHVESTVNLYADDTIIYNTSPDTIQKDLARIWKWCNCNLLTVNCKKSQWMKTRIIEKWPGDQRFKLGNNKLEHVSEYKYLGLNIDSTLPFQQYRENIINRVNLKICYFRKIRPLLTKEAAILIYKCTILQILEYADFVYDFNIKYNCKRLQTIQNTGLYVALDQYKLLYDEKDYTETLHRNVKLARLSHRRNLHMLSFVYNYINDNRFLDHRNINTRRREGILFDVYYKVDHYKARNDPLLRAMESWNSLPVYIRNADTKLALKTMLFNNIVNPFAKTE